MHLPLKKTSYFVLLLSVIATSGCINRANIAFNPPSGQPRIYASAIQVVDERSYDFVTTGFCLDEHNMDYMALPKLYFTPLISGTGNPMTIRIKQLQYCVADSGGSFVNIVPILGTILYSSMETFYHRAYFNGTFEIAGFTFPIEAQIQETKKGRVDDRDEFLSNFFGRLFAKVTTELTTKTNVKNSGQ